MSPQRVLVVEDDYLLQGVIVDIFERRGLDVVSASSAEAALTLIRDQGQSIDWLFTDINLPGLIDGWQIVSVFRQRYPRRPIIVASAGPRDDQSMVAGSIFIQKPYLPADIVSIAALVRHQFADDEAIKSEFSIAEFERLSAGRATGSGNLGGTAQTPADVRPAKTDLARPNTQIHVSPMSGGRPAFAWKGDPEAGGSTRENDRR
jgi:CheY-like chemotaxis protein